MNIGWKKQSFIEIKITELMFPHISILLTDYLLFILTSFAISPGKTFNRPKKRKNENLRIFSQSIVGKKGQTTMMYHIYGIFFRVRN